jgi:STE24 endopeptidase
MAKSARWLFAALLACALAGGFAPQALAQVAPMAAPTVHIQVHALPSPGVVNFDPHKSVDAYLSRISGKAKANSDAYFEGGYVLSFVDVLYTIVIAGLLLWLRLSAWMRNTAVRMTRHRFLQVPIYVVQYLVVTTIVGLPLTIYEGFTREHAYGLSNQSFLQWAGDFGIQFAVSVVAFTILLTLIYAAARAAKGRWWIWGTGITAAFMVVMLVISPVYIAPLFNHYAPLPESGLKSSILSMARANGIPADNIYTFDASRQSTRISANVSGFLGTTRISLNDNLLNRGTPSEVLAVLGHEMGHYVLNHVAILLTWFGLLILVGFVFVDRAYRGLTNLFGGSWDVRTIGDPAGLPLIMALFSVFMLAATPVTNTIIRTHEIQADIFGLNAVRQPDAFATVALKMSDYRKLEPSPWEEFVFYDHPSGRTRIWEAMRWKAEHLNDPDILDGPISPQ